MKIFEVIEKYSKDNEDEGVGLYYNYENAVAEMQRLANFTAEYWKTTVDNVRWSIEIRSGTHSDDGTPWIVVDLLDNDEEFNIVDESYCYTVIERELL